MSSRLSRMAIMSLVAPSVPPPAPVTGLIGHWPFDSITTGTTPDTSGNANDGTVVGSTLSAGKIGNALTFGTGTQYVNLGHGSATQAGNNFTLSAWVYPTLDSIRGVILSFRGTGNQASAPQFEVGKGNAGAQCLLISSVGHFDYQSANFVITLNSWQLVAFSKIDATHQKGYVNGVPVATAIDAPITYADSTQDKLVGVQSTTPANPFSGLIDDLRIYSPHLSDADILTLFQSAG